MAAFEVSKTLPAALQGLEPAGLWSFFGQLASIPRPSYHEQRVCDWIKAFAEERSLRWRQDAAGNMVVYRPGSAGGEAAAPIILQGHLDMVTEKDASVQHDFLTDPIRLLREGGWITADGTTLGADNGIGVCAALALLDEPASTPLPPLEALFTVDEETGMTGAAALDGGMLTGRLLLNLDTEEWGEVYVGCAGGGDTRLTLVAPRQAAPAGAVALGYMLNGMLGGHSGIDIHEDRANAVRLAARAAAAALKAVPGAALAELRGGDKRNAIPRAAQFALIVPATETDAVAAAVRAAFADFQAEYGRVEAEMALQTYRPDAEAVATCFTPEAVDKIMLLLLGLPHGVVKFSHAVPGLVETSSNLASIAPLDGPTSAAQRLQIVTCTRSSIDSALHAVRESIRRVGEAAGAEVVQEPAYPGWAAEPDARIVTVTRAAIERVTGRVASVKALHAGLECGILKTALPGCQCVSFGPTITGAHSPAERVEIETVAPFYAATLGLLRDLALGDQN